MSCNMWNKDHWSLTFDNFTVGIGHDYWLNLNNKHLDWFSAQKWARFFCNLNTKPLWTTSYIFWHYDFVTFYQNFSRRYSIAAWINKYKWRLSEHWRIGSEAEINAYSNLFPPQPIYLIELLFVDSAGCGGAAERQYRRHRFWNILTLQ